MNFFNAAVVALCFVFAYGDEFAPSQDCTTMQPFCTSSDIQYAAATDYVPEEDNTDYGCLNTRPNPSWYYMKIAVGGDMNIGLTSTFGNTVGDIDFALWGPFDSLDSAIDQCGSYSSPSSCSYSPDATEIAEVRNANVGEYYVFLITNYADAEDLLITFQKEDDSGTAESDCSAIQCEFNIGSEFYNPCGSELFAGTECATSCASGYEYAGGDLTAYCDSFAVLSFTGVCTEINGCDANPCPQYSDCINNGMGNYACDCWDGYFMDGDYCVEIDMCADDPCDVNAMCYNVDGSSDFTCECNEGYEGDGFFCEMPVEEECEEEVATCDKVSISKNVINVQFADIFAGYDGYMTNDPWCCN
jgi:hypothetical protein